jgi:hypothetical protein
MRFALVIAIVGCAPPMRPFPLRDPFVVDTDMQEVSVTCRPDPDKDEPKRMRCAPREYVSPFLWDNLDNLLFAPVSRAFAVTVTGEARNVNSLDEVPDSAWFTNHPSLREHDDGAPGACTPADMLPGPDEVAAGTWVIDQGKENGSTLGFRIDVPGKGKYMLKADDQGKPERASASSVIGAAVYDAIGFNTSCEQVVVLKKAQLKLKPGLHVTSNAGITTPFDDSALDKVLASTTQLPGGAVRMQASKWLPGLTLGPFRYIGTRDDDPNDVIDHADRRELRGNRVLSAWLDHWDAREQNSMDVWMAVNDKDTRSSPGHVVHYILDTSDTLGGEVGIDDMSRRLGHAYEFDAVDFSRAVLSFGADERPWDRAHYQRGREKFAYFTARDFDPERWRPYYPNPAFERMTERDAAWMARKIAKFSPEDIRAFIALGKWSKPDDAEYVARILIVRQRILLARYLTRISPLGDVGADGNQICATDFARLRQIEPPEKFRYSAVIRGRHVPASAGPDGRVCIDTAPSPRRDLRDDDPQRRVEIVVRNGTGAGPLIIHAYDLDGRGLKIVGLTRSL